MVSEDSRQAISLPLKMENQLTHPYFCKIFSVTKNLYKVAAHFQGVRETKGNTSSAAIVLLATLVSAWNCKLIDYLQHSKTPMHPGSSAFCFDVFLSTVNHLTVI
jgi:hypothetical protein